MPNQQQAPIPKLHSFFVSHQISITAPPRAAATNPAAPNPVSLAIATACALLELDLNDVIALPVTLGTLELAVGVIVGQFVTQGIALVKGTSLAGAGEE